MLESGFTIFNCNLNTENIKVLFNLALFNDIIIKTLLLPYFSCLSDVPNLITN